MGVVLGAPSAAAPVGPESWYDAEHGWRLVPSNIQETNDGGRTWRNLYRRGLGAVSVAGVLRTGFRAGVWREAGGNDHWTNDGQSFHVSPGLHGASAGAGRFLFTVSGRSVFRVTPWPFPYACVASTATLGCVYKDRRGVRHVARFAATRVVTVPTGRVGAVATVPGGAVVVNFAETSSDVPYVAVARWLRRDDRAPLVVAQALPVDVTGATLTSCGGPVFVEWPRLVVPACALIVNRLEPAGYWEALDGGRTWRHAAPSATPRGLRRTHARRVGRTSR